MLAFVTPAFTVQTQHRSTHLVGRKPHRYVLPKAQREARLPARVLCSAESNASPGDIQLLACDMDGTMLDTNSLATEQNIRAVRRLLDETDVVFAPATGKSRGGVIRALAGLGDYLNFLHPNGCPGVFLQGLIVYGLNGEVVYENKCSAELARTIVDISEELNLSLIAFSRDSIFCTKADAFTDTLPTYHEPQAAVIKSWDKLIDAAPLNKFIFMAEPSRINEVRPFVAERIGAMGVLTQAQGDMLEVLPPSSSKGDGVTRLLHNLAISPDNVLAIGDAENDLEMLKMVQYSCAVGNALPSVKAVAKYCDLSSNNDSGVAEAIERFILKTSEVPVYKN